MFNNTAAKICSYLKSKTILLYHCLAGTSLMVDSNNHQILLNPYLCHITSFLFGLEGVGRGSMGCGAQGLPLLFPNGLHGEHCGNNEFH
jgi:hypothetical protein